MLKIKIEEDKSIVNGNKIILFDQPARIFIPLIQGKNQYLPILKQGDYVYQEEKIALRKSDHFPLFSSISGIVKQIDATGIMIENDYQNRVRNRQIEEFDYSKYSKEKISLLLFELGIQNIGVMEEDPYLKFSPHHTFKTLIVNALQQEPYVYLEWFQLKIERKQLLEVLERLLDIYNFEEILIIIPKHQSLLLEEWSSCIWDPKIKLMHVEEYYALSNSRELIKQIKGITFQNDPYEKGIVVLNVSTLFSIHQALKYQRPTIRFLLQFTGNMWKKNCYIEVRVGSYLKEIIGQIDFKRAKELLLLKGSLMKGFPVSLDDVIIFSDIPVYSAWKPMLKKPSTSCIRCGKCMKVCPMKLSPVLIMDAILKNHKVDRFQVERCIECGLCSYICPSNITVEEFILKAKEKKV